MEISIRPLEEDDAYTSVKWRNIAELWAFTKFKADKEITIDDELCWVRKVIADNTSRRFAIIADGVYVGNIYLTGIGNGEAEYHIFIGEKSYWGKGIARKASQLIINYGRDVLNLKKITLSVRPDNAGAFHLYKSLGFVETGEHDGEFVTMELGLGEK